MHCLSHNFQVESFSFIKPKKSLILLVKLSFLWSFYKLYVTKHGAVLLHRFMHFSTRSNYLLNLHFLFVSYQSYCSNTQTGPSVSFGTNVLWNDDFTEMINKFKYHAILMERLTDRFFVSLGLFDFLIWTFFFTNIQECF